MKCFKYLFLVCVISLCCSAYTFAQDVDGGVTLAWDANTESDLDRYNLHIGTTTGSYDTVIDVGNVTQYTASGLAVGTIYYFALTAFDTWNNESKLSLEVSATAKDIILPRQPTGLREVTTSVNNLLEEE